MNVDAATREVLWKVKRGSGQSEVGESASPHGYDFPDAMAVDTHGNIYIVDNYNERIQTFSKNGKWIRAIQIWGKPDKYYSLVKAIITDKSNSLYVPIFSNKLGKINIYSPHSPKPHTIELRKLPIRWWDSTRGWAPGYIQIERIYTDLLGNIYLKGFDELVKLDRSGKLVYALKIEMERYQTVPESGHLLVVTEQRSEIDVLDGAGQRIRTEKCSVGTYTATTNDAKCKVASFVDGKGFGYWISDDGKRIDRIDKAGNLKDSIKFTDITLGGFPITFGHDGSVYFLLGNETEYWVEKISW